MRIAPRRITATGLPTCNVDYVFNSEAQSVELTCSSGRQIERRHEGIALSDSDRGVFSFQLASTQAGLFAVSLQGTMASDVEEKKSDG